VAHAVTLLAGIREALGSNIGRTPNLTECFVVFRSCSMQLSGEHLKLGHDGFFPHNFQFTIMKFDAIVSTLLGSFYVFLFNDAVRVETI
jgi:hypothetical protein